MKHLRNIFIILFSAFICSHSYANDEIFTLEVPDKIGLEQTLVVTIDAQVSKIRELHISILNMSTWQQVRKARSRIKESGKFNVSFDIKDFQPGKYRVDAFLAPRGKTFPDRLAEPSKETIEVVNTPIYKKPKKLSKSDKIKSVSFPKVISGNGEFELTIDYDITQARSLDIKLLNSSDWKEHGSVVLPVKETGSITIPMSNLTDDFPLGKYAWVVRINTKDGSENLVKLGKHFELVE